uniref:carcinoembryonic antigen-related cell adhesion molecule 5 isoform X2 n=1 Tax=Doryrhamphus excisus TaxID=161450 RepID=UPI0025ADB791|nr:carcinoembryonic antigen-related cell adhesion molecule 5 isoform X2 [Doryrhamphus excisus]
MSGIQCCQRKHQCSRASYRQLFGPDDIHLNVSPLQQYIAEGSNVVFSCSAASRPLALISWALDGEPLSYNGPEISLMNIQENQSGKYSCQAFNTKTLRRKTSQLVSVNVLKNISDGSIVASTSQPIEGMPVNLTCEAAGSIFNREWMKSGSALLPDDNMALHDEGRVLSFHAVRRSDSGTYSCRISNPINMEEVAYGMAINYGPESVQISGPKEITVKHTLTLTCSATSVPSATYTWKQMNQSEIHNTSIFVINNVDFSDSGSYICIASNNITGVNVSAQHRLAVTEENPPLCTAGCIAGIVIASLVICAASAGGGYYIYNKQKQSKNPNSGNITTRTERDRKDNTTDTRNEDQDLNYADLTFFHAKEGQFVPQNNSSVYTEIRVNKPTTAESSPPSYNVHMQRIKRRAPQPFETDEIQV